MKVVAKNLTLGTDHEGYIGQTAEVLAMSRAATWCPVSLHVRFADGRELHLSSDNYTASPEDQKIIDKTRAAKSGPKPAALRRMQRNSARSAH